MRAAAFVSLLLAAGCTLPVCAQQVDVSALRQRGSAALAAEQERAKVHDCKAAMNTADTAACYRNEQRETTRNYENYVASVSALLTALPPGSSLPERQASRENRKNFRLGESLWLRYREAACDAVELMSCEGDLTRNHLLELGTLYERLFQ